MNARVYVPATLELLRTWAQERVVPVAAERYLAGGADPEQAEYDALMAAADAAAALVGARGRRVVLVAEVADPDAEIAWHQLAAVHADPADVDTSAPDDLDEPAWYAVQEVPALLGD